MSIKTVDNSNLAEYVAERTAKATELQTPSQVTEAVTRIAEAKGESPVIEAKETKPNVAGAPDPGVQEPTAKKNPVQPRIDELTRQKRELEEFAENEYDMRLRAERRIGELEESLKSSKPSPAEIAKEDKEPDPATYTDQALFIKEWGAWNRKEAIKEFNQLQENIAEQRRIAIKEADLGKQIEEARAEIEDFDEVINTGRDVKIPDHINEALLESDYTAKLAYYLRKNPEERDRLYGLPRAKALLELGKLEMKYTKADAKALADASVKPSTITETTKAPAPPPKLKGNDGGVVVTNLTGPMNFKDYKRLSLEQKRSGVRR